MLRANNLNDLLDVSLSRTNLGLKNSATKDVGTAAGTVAAGDDSRFTSLASSIALAAPLASPALTGNPTAPTPAAGDNDTSIATTAFVHAEAVLKSGDTMTGNLTVTLPEVTQASPSVRLPDISRGFLSRKQVRPSGRLEAPPTTRSFSTTIRSAATSLAPPPTARRLMSPGALPVRRR